VGGAAAGLGPALVALLLLLPRAAPLLLAAPLKLHQQMRAEEHPVQGVVPRIAYLVSGSARDGAALRRTLRALYHLANMYVVHLDLEAPAAERAELAAAVRVDPSTPGSATSRSSNGRTWSPTMARPWWPIRCTRLPSCCARAAVVWGAGARDCWGMRRMDCDGRGAIHGRICGGEDSGRVGGGGIGGGRARGGGAGAGAVYT
jgi:hypothetical protein